MLMGIGSMTIAQTHINLEIRHTLNGMNAVMDTVETNNLNNDFKITRLQYYITRISIIHDGNQITAIDDSVVTLINVDDELVTTIPLGPQNFTNIEGVKFHIGVYAPLNNDDPSLWPSTHPLAPQIPSMHWMWHAGYRFIAFEGVSGINFSQIWEFHTLGNDNYFEINPVMTSSSEVSGVETIKIDANYVEALRDIKISQGVYSHVVDGTGPAVTAIENFRDYVFSAPSTTVSVEASEEQIKFSLLNNPAIEGHSKISYDAKLLGKTLKIHNMAGQEVQSIILNGSGIQNIQLNKPGIYFVSLISNEGIFKTLKLINK